MNCPKCKGAVTHPGEFCVACGFRFGKELSEQLSFYFDLKQEFEQFRSFQSDLRDGIEKVAGKIQTYEALIGRDLDAMAASLAAEEKTGKAEGAGEFSSVASDIPAPPEEGKARMEKFILTVIIIMFVLGMGFWLYRLVRKLAHENDSRGRQDD